MTDLEGLLRRTTDLAIEHLATLDDRPVFPSAPAAELRAAIAADLPDGPLAPTTVIEELAAAVAPGLTLVPGGRYFGFVTGGAVPAALAADWLTATWDQNAFSYVSSPAASIVEDIAAGWIKEILRLPEGASVGFTTGCQMAHVTALAAARHDVLRTAGWDVAAAGLSGAPPIRVVTGEKRHVTVDRALRLIGIGSDAIDIVPVDAEGRASAAHIADRLAVHRGPTIVVAQAGEVNTGSFDPIPAIAAVASEHGAWLHVDGAFGIWARVSERLEALAAGVEQADSWAFDAHKWLNVPYDSGVAVVAHPEAHRASMLGPAAYLAATGSERDAYDWTAEASRRARGFAIYAALRSLGRSGVTDLIDRCCAHARRFAERLAALPGCEIVNDVALNQVLIRFGDDETTNRVLEKIQRGGVAWMGGTTWDGRAAIRISVSSWATTVEDVDRTVAAFAAAVA